MTLDQVPKGQWAAIRELPDGDVRAQIIRFGLGEGEAVQCAEVLPGGPVVVRKGTFHLAVGRRLARRITVQPLEGAPGGTGR
ncbi:MAG: FeoA family protein [Bacillota bacterium]